MIDTIICGDCLEVMPTIPDNSVDMVLADLPYGVTHCKWDSVIPLNLLWPEWLRICKGAMVFTAMQPFTSTLVMSNPKWFSHDLIYYKPTTTGFLNANRMPLRAHEHILIFGKGLTFNPQFTKGKPNNSRGTYEEYKGDIYGDHNKKRSAPTTKKYPRSVIRFNRPPPPLLHPTQKPVALFEYLIRTYTNEGDTVLDPTCGSGTTAVACRKSNRHYICIEKEQEYCAIAETRIAEIL